MRSQKRRDGTDETALRHNIALDVSSLMNTIRLDVCADLADTPRVARSVVNFGFQDMDTLWRDHTKPSDMAAAIRQTLSITNRACALPRSRCGLKKAGRALTNACNLKFWPR